MQITEDEKPLIEENKNQSNSSPSINLEDRKQQIIILISFLLLTFITELFFRQPLFDFSVNFVKNFHKDKTEGSFIIILCQILAKVGNTIGYGTIIIISYNWFNIYRTSFLLLNLLICTCLVGTLKMIYIGPRPYFMSDQILSVSCEGGWGNPSGHSMTAVSFILSLWKVIFQINKMKEKEIAKKISLVGFITLIFLILFSRLLIGAHSLNQILFGGLIGLGLFYFYFYVLEIDTENPNQFLFLMKFDLKNIFQIIPAINLFLIILALVFYYVNTGSLNESKYLDIITTKCPKVSFAKKLQNEGLVGFSAFLSNMGIFIGIIYEFYYTFDKNEKNWKNYNFDSDNENNLNQLNSSRTDNKKWNQMNNVGKDILRLLMLGCLAGICSILLIFLHSENLAVVIVFKYVFSLNLVFFGMFGVYKDVYRYFNLANPLPDNSLIELDENTDDAYKKIT